MGRWGSVTFLKCLAVIFHAAILIALQAQGHEHKSDSNLKLRLTSVVSGSGEIPGLINMEPLPHSCRNGISSFGLDRGKWHGTDRPATPYSFDYDSREP
jgi:hypothetical protein